MSIKRRHSIKRIKGLENISLEPNNHTENFYIPLDTCVSKLERHTT